jgi:hypothetical protein
MSQEFLAEFAPSHQVRKSQPDLELFSPLEIKWFVGGKMKEQSVIRVRGAFPLL